MAIHQQVLFLTGVWLRSIRGGSVRSGGSGRGGGID